MHYFSFCLLWSCFLIADIFQLIPLKDFLQKFKGGFNRASKSFDKDLSGVLSKPDPQAVRFTSAVLEHVIDSTQTSPEDLAEDLAQMTVGPLPIGERSYRDHVSRMERVFHGKSSAALLLKMTFEVMTGSTSIPSIRWPSGVALRDSFWKIPSVLNFTSETWLTTHIFVVANRSN
jgi:hypothetical protein